LSRDSFIANITRAKKTACYLSIVVAGTDADFTPLAVGRFLRAVEFGLVKARTADIEIIFVEYNVSRSVRDDIEVPPPLTGRVRFIAVDNEAIETPIPALRDRRPQRRHSPLSRGVRPQHNDRNTPPVDVFRTHRPRRPQ
jgi:hypothetical protein